MKFETFKIYSTSFQVQTHNLSIPKRQKDGSHYTRNHTQKEPMVYKYLKLTILIMQGTILKKELMI